MSTDFEPGNTTGTSSRLWHICLLILSVLIPLSCSAQNNVLNRISSTERSDGKGHVIRFHLQNAPSSMEYAQPQAYLVQLQLKGSNIDSANIQLQDDSDIINRVDYYAIDGGLGVDLFLAEETYYRASAYPDRSGNDFLVGLTQVSAKQLATHIETMEKFSWSNAPETNAPLSVDETQNETTAAVDTTYQKVKNKIKFDVVVLDAGHGGTEDVGAIGHNGIYEKNVVLDITKKVGNYIKQSKDMEDVKVVYTRDDDTFIELEERGPIANRAEGDLFVSIHANSAGSRQAHGTETYFLGMARTERALEVMRRENKVINPDGVDTKTISQEELAIYELANSGYIASSEKLAGMVEDQFENRAQRRSRGVKQAPFVVLYQASMPAILIETGFISNPSEAQYLNSEYGQNIIASAIFRAIRNYKLQFEKSQN